MNQLRQSKRIVNLATVTTTNSTQIVTLPLADVYTFILNTGSGTGTSPTCDVSLQITPDGGTSWVNTGYKFTQSTTGAVGCMITVNQTKAMLSASSVVAATGSLVSKDTVLSDKVRFLITIAGTNPSYATITIDMFCKTFAL